MILKYYKYRQDIPNSECLIYASRKRVKNFSNLEDCLIGAEEQQSIKFGDGAHTIIKTSEEYLCDYVIMQKDENSQQTRWYVIAYQYLNGGQVQIQLQRDVVSEFGISNCFGKIERGYTDSILKYRKELDVNQILKERKKLVQVGSNRGNFDVLKSDEEMEMWGILYFIPPKENVTVQIPSLIPKTVSVPSGIEFEKKYKVRNDFNYYVSFNLNVKCQKSREFARYNFVFKGVFNSPNTISINYEAKKVSFSSAYKVIGNVVNDTYDNIVRVVAAIAENCRIALTQSFSVSPAYPVSDSFKEKIDFISNNNIEESGNFYFVRESEVEDTFEIKYSTSSEIENRVIEYSNNTSCKIVKVITDDGEVYSDCYFYEVYKILSKELLSASESGQIVITNQKDYIDEPYVIYVMPLFNCNINDYNIKKTEAFDVFNLIIESLSGENPYLVDAQIYPYCPFLKSVAIEVAYGENKFPVFSILSTSYETSVDVNLLPYMDVKKEYITRKYSIVSPDQSGSFSFNFYDYVNEFEENQSDYSKNFKKLNAKIKTALKPFSIISSAVITPTKNSLIGKTYESDLRGCSCSSNGFECSLTSNAFETYKRQNSNYQQIFNLQKEELQRTHDTERVNEKTAAVVNTISATTMGAIGGGAVGSGFTSIGKSAGAVIGGAAAGATVGTAMGLQYEKNEELREFEVYLQRQNFDLAIGTIKNIPNSVNRISSFNEIIVKNFYYCVEVYECSEDEIFIIENFINKYGYGIGVFDFIINYVKENWFIRASLISSSYPPLLHNIAKNELAGGIYYNEQG